jgi:hypothetical protein
MIHTVHARHTNLRQIYAFSLIAIWPFARAFFSPPPPRARGTINSLVAFLFPCAFGQRNMFYKEVETRKKTFSCLFSLFHFGLSPGRSSKKPGKSFLASTGRPANIFQQEIENFLTENHGQNIYIHSVHLKIKRALSPSRSPFFLPCVCVLFYPRSCSVIYGLRP